MIAKRKIRGELIALLVLVVSVWVGGPAVGFFIGKYDAWRLARFVQRISSADRIVASYPRSSIHLTLTGDKVHEMVRAVMSAHSTRPPLGMVYSCSFLTKATFFQGTNALDDVEICGDLFLLHEKEPPFRDGTRALSDGIEMPLGKMILDEAMKKAGIKQ